MRTVRKFVMAGCLAWLWLAPYSTPALSADGPNLQHAAPADSAKPSSVQTNGTEAPHKKSIEEMMAHARDAVKASSASPDVDVLVEEAFKKCYINRDIQCNAAIDLHDRQWKEEFAQQSYAWHLFSSKLIFCLVIAIVIFGLFVTYIQFNRDYRDWAPAHHVISPAPTVPSTLPEGQAVTETVTSSRPVTSLKLSAGGLELSSQVIGLIVLALSFGFFYLYVKEIHPMVERHSDLVPPMYAPAAQ
jgi:hypothetical protein